MNNTNNDLSKRIIFNPDGSQKEPDWKWKQSAELLDQEDYDLPEER